MALVRAPEFGAEWESAGPGITDASTEFRIPVPDGEPVELRGTVGRFGAYPVRLQITAREVLEVAVTGGPGAVELPGVDATPLSEGGRIRVCLDEGGCVCPDGEPLGLPQSQPGDGVAAVGSVDGGEVAVVATPITIEEACDRSRLVGEWTTDVSHVMSALGTVYGTLPACTGPWVATFREDGTWAAGYLATCSVAGQRGEGRASFTGTYVDNGTSFTVANIRGEGSMTLNGVTMPLPIVDGFRQALGGTSEYTILGDQLTYIVVTPEGNRVPISLNRTG